MTPDAPKPWYLTLIATAALLAVYPSLSVAHAQVKAWCMAGCSPKMSTHCCPTNSC